MIIIKKINELKRQWNIDILFNGSNMCRIIHKNIHILKLWFTLKFYSLPYLLLKFTLKVSVQQNILHQMKAETNHDIYKKIKDKRMIPLK